MDLNSIPTNEDYANLTEEEILNGENPDASSRDSEKKELVLVVPVVAEVVSDGAIFTTTEVMQIDTGIKFKETSDYITYNQIKRMGDMITSKTSYPSYFSSKRGVILFDDQLWFYNSETSGTKITVEDFLDMFVDYAVEVVY